MSAGETNLESILASLKPRLHDGEYVFCVVGDVQQISPDEIVMYFKEREGTTVILKKEYADQKGLAYNYLAAWITLEVHSSLDAVGLTACFSKALTDAGISCNVVAGYYHDHIFVSAAHADKAMQVLTGLSAHS